MMRMRLYCNTHLEEGVRRQAHRHSRVNGIEALPCFVLLKCFICEGVFCQKMGKEISILIYILYVVCEVYVSFLAMLFYFTAVLK